MNKRIVLKFSKKKARNKMITLSFYVLIMLLFSLLISNGDLKRGAFAFSAVFIVFALPQLVIHFNYLKHDKGKKIIFDYKNNLFQEFRNGELISEIKISSISATYKFNGSIDGYENGLPHMQYDFYKVCTKKEVFIFSDFLQNKELDFSPNVVAKKFRFFNLMNLENNYKLEQSKIIKESNNIDYYSDKRTLKYIEQYESKTDKELYFIIENKKSYQVEAVKAAQFILKGR